MTANDVSIGVTFRYEPNEAIVRVRGELDLLSAHDFAALLDAGVQHRENVTLDLADLHFCGAEGLRIIELLARRLQASGGRVVVRSASAMLTKMLAVTGVAALVDLEAATTAPVAPGDLAPALEAALLPLLCDAAEDAMFAVLARLGRALSRASAASVTMQRRDRLETVASTDDVAFDLDEAQYAVGDGPCVTAATTGRQVEVGGDDTAAGWPALRREADRGDIRGVLSTPLVSAGVPIGALNLYAGRAIFTDAERELALLLAAETPTLAMGASDNALLGGRLRTALESRDLIARAQGMLMERTGLHADDGYTSLRRESQATSIPLRDVAAGLTELSTNQLPTRRLEGNAP